MNECNHMHNENATKVLTSLKGNQELTQVKPLLFDSKCVCM